MAVGRREIAPVPPALPPLRALGGARPPPADRGLRQRGRPAAQLLGIPYLTLERLAPSRASHRHIRKRGGRAHQNAGVQGFVELVAAMIAPACPVTVDFNPLHPCHFGYRAVRQQTKQAEPITPRIAKMSSGVPDKRKLLVGENVCALSLNAGLFHALSRVRLVLVKQTLLSAPIKHH